MMDTNLQNKAENWLSQKKRVFQSLYSKPQTRLQVSVRTQTPIQNVCRIVGQFRQSNTLFVLGKDTCPISKMQAEVVSTNPAFAPKEQLNLFQ
jgi:hypothetical protein